MPEQQNETADVDAIEEEIDDDQEQTDGDGDEPEWTPPTREEWEEQQKQLAAAQAKTKRANDQARKLREAKQKAAEASGAEPPAANTEDLAKWQARAVRASAKVQLIARGADADMVDLALARLKPADVEFDDDDEPDLTYWLDDMEDKFPKLFKQPEAPAPAAAKAKAGRIETPTGRGPRPKMSLGEQIMANSQGAPRRGR